MFNLRWLWVRFFSHILTGYTLPGVSVPRCKSPQEVGKIRVPSAPLDHCAHVVAQANNVAILVIPTGPLNYTFKNKMARTKSTIESKKVDVPN